MQKMIDINNDKIDEILYHIQKDSFLNAHYLSLMDEKQTKELNFLEKKRENNQLKLRINKDFTFQKENFAIKKNESKSCLINFGVNSCKKSFDESLDNPNLKENNKINTITDDKKTNLINKRFINNNTPRKEKYFNVIKNNDKCSFDEDNNNEVKILKNKKAVYINKNLLNLYTNSQSSKIFKKFKFKIQKKTRSKYIGIYKNDNK